MRERLKDLFLIMLFLSAVGLTVLLLVDKNAYFDKKVDRVETQIVELDGLKYIKPFNYEVFLSGDNNGVVYENRLNKIELWDIVVGSVSRYFEYGKIRKVDEDKWIEEKTKRSLTVNFEYRFTFDEFRQLLTNKGSFPEEDLYETRFDSIIIPARETQTIYIGDKSRKNYYEVKDIPITMNNISDLIEIFSLKSAKNEMMQYWNLTDVLGLEEKSVDTLVPVFNSGMISPINTNKEIDLSLESNLNVRSYAGKMFGENFEFVNKNKLNDGSILYMYGYGDKSYRFSADGSIEYIDKTNSASEKKMTFKSGLDMALGGLSKVGEIPNDLFLEDFIVEQSDVQKKLTYKFGYKINGYPVVAIDKDYADLEIEIIDGNIYRIYKNVRKYQSAEKPEEIVKFIRLIDTENVGRFVENYLESASLEMKIEEDFVNRLKVYINKIEDDEEVLESEDVLINLLARIKNFKLEYQRLEYNQEEILIPTWQFDLGRTHYSINAYNFKILSETRL